MDSIQARAAETTTFRRYYYEPSLPAAIIFVVLFGISTLLHVFQMFQRRTWFMIPFIIGAVMETVGYIGRAISATEAPGPYTMGPFIIQSVLLLVAPALLAASIYMNLGRIVFMIKGEDALFIRRTWLTKIFVIGDVISFMVQSSGAGILSSGDDQDSIDTGNWIIIGGLIIQVIFFGLFVIAGVIFHVRMNKAPTQLSNEKPWVKHMIGLYIVSILIFIRSIVRVVEFVEGWGGYLMTHEVYLYVFDAAVMFLAVACLNWTHPGEVAKYVRERRGEYERAKDETHSMEEMTA